jgi:hypothetical protein
VAYTLTFLLQLEEAPVSAQLVDTTGADVGGPVTTGFVSFGSDFYGWTHTAIPDGFRGFIEFTNTIGDLLTMAELNPQEAENNDVKVSTRLATSQWISEAPAAPAIAATVWDTARASHVDAGSMGHALSLVETDVTPGVNVANGALVTVEAALATALTAITAIKAKTDQLAFTGGDVVASLSATGLAAILDRATSSLTVAGSIGKRIGDLLDVAVSSRATTGDVQGITTVLTNNGWVVLDQGKVYVLRGNAYTGELGLLITNPTWPDLTGATVTLRVQLGEQFLTKTLTVVDEQIVKLELSEEETLELEAGEYAGRLKASLADGTAVTLQRITLDATYAA